MTRTLACLAALIAVLPAASLRLAEVAAQDTSRVNEGVRVGLEYQPGVRPGLVVLPGPGLDSVRAIVRRDLDYSDRFEMLDAGTAPATGGATGTINYGI